MEEKGSRPCFRLGRAERVAIERGLDGRESGRSIARSLGRSNATVSDEVRRNRTVARGPGKGGRAEGAPEDACPKLLRWPWVCNGCRCRRRRCTRKWRCEYSAARAQALADGLLSEARRGASAREADFEAMMAAARPDVARGLSPTQIVEARKGQFEVSASTLYRWIERGYAGMSNMDLRRKVGYKPRRAASPAEPTPHGPERSFAAFLALPADRRGSACEMDCVIGRARGGRRARLVGAGRRQRGARPPARPHPRRQRVRVLRLRVDRGAGPAGRGGPVRSVLLRRAPVPAEGGLRAQPRRAEEASAQGAGHLLRHAGRTRLRRAHEPAQLRAEALAFGDEPNHDAESRHAPRG